MRACEADAAAAAAAEHQRSEADQRKAVGGAADAERAAHEVTRRLLAVATRETSEQQAASHKALQKQAEELRASAAASLKEVSDRLAAATEQLESWDFLPQDSAMMIASPLVGEGEVRRVGSLYLVVDLPQEVLQRNLNEQTQRQLANG